jgi:hypothetical protein
VLLLAGAVQAAPRTPDLAGCYEGGQMELAAELDLKPDGHFQYGLAYGALDEEAQGRWESDGANVYLTSEPVTAPRFSLLSQGQAPRDRFVVELDIPHGMDRQYFDVLLMLQNGHAIQRQMGEDGLVAELSPGDKVAAVRLALPVYELASEPFPVTGNAAHFRFEPNDLGKVAFTHTPLRIDGHDLLIDRFDRQLRFRRGEKCEL